MSNFTIHSNTKPKIKLSSDGYLNLPQNNHRSTINSYHHIHLNNNNTSNKEANAYYFPKIKINSNVNHLHRLHNFTIKNKDNSFSSRKSNQQTPKRNNSKDYIKHNSHNKQQCLLSQEGTFHSHRIIKEQSKKFQLRKINIVPIQVKDIPIKIAHNSNIINEHKNIKENIIKRCKPQIKINLSVPEHHKFNTIYHKPIHVPRIRKCDLVNNKIQSLSFSKKNSLSIDSSIKYQQSTACSQSAVSKYIIGKEIGKGAYATVRICLCKKNKVTYAAKIYTNFLNNHSLTKRSAVNKEIEILKQLNHPNLITLYHHFFEQSSLYLIMELARGMRLSLYLKAINHHKLDEIQSKRVFYQLLSALNYLHSINICHRDIKLDNIITNQNLDIKLIDFGFATKLSHPNEKLTLFCGTPNYMAPEIVKKLEYIGPPTDMWSSGIILYYLLTGTFPFKGKNQSELSSRIITGAFPLPKNISINAHHLLTSLLHINPDKRISASKALKHNWFNK